MVDPENMSMLEKSINFAVNSDIFGYFEMLKFCSRLRYFRGTWKCQNFAVDSDICGFFENARNFAVDHDIFWLFTKY